jgi:hypothetical protein
MTRFAWAAWGLLVVVLDLPFAGWDVLPDIVGYAWIVIGLAGAASVHPALVRARAAAAAGIPVALVTGTPLFVGQDGIIWGAVFAETVLTVVLLHQLATAIRDLAPEAGDSDQRRWANGIRVAAPVSGLVRLVGLVFLATPLGALYALGYLGLVVTGIVSVVLLHRVHRAGWLATTPDAVPADPADPAHPADPTAPA